MLIRSAYRFAAQPKPHQEAKLREWAPALRFVWNWALKQRRDIYSASEDDGEFEFCPADEKEAAEDGQDIKDFKKKAVVIWP